MIFVDRSAFTLPSDIARALAESQAGVQDFLALPAATREQRRAPFDLPTRVRRQLGQALFALFKGKCAFCESYVSSERFSYDHFWPRSTYPERAFAWDNLYLCCAECNLYKSNKFPLLQQGRTGRVRGQHAPDTPLILDPCNSAPEASLRFREDGEVESLDHSGSATINTFALNRPQLRMQRRLRARAALAMCEKVWDRAGSSEWMDQSSFIAAVAAEMGGERGSHLAVVRQCAVEFLGQKAGTGVQVQRPGTDKLAANVPAPTKWLKSVVIRNFKSIAQLELDFPPPVAERQPWIMLLGENGVGKSTVLHAIALALMGPERARLGAPAKWLRRGCRTGSVCLRWNDGSPDFVIRFSNDGRPFDIEGEEPDVPILAYGSIRLLPEESSAGVPVPRKRNVANLFNKLQPLAAVQAYLCDKSLVPRSTFNALAIALKQLLDLGEEDLIVRGKAGLSASIGGQKTSFDELSDGRKSVLALAMDIMFNFAGKDGDMRYVEGLVLLDEIELHLHPRWKAKIVKLLRDMFPRIRFIATTHDPLCANSLEEGELQVLVEQPGTRKRYIEGIDIPPGTRADDILTGPWFGLQSTMDDDTMRKLSEHSVLLQKMERNDEEAETMRELEQSLRKRLGSYGDTQAQRALLAVNAILQRPVADSHMDKVSRARLLAVRDGKRKDHGDA